MKKILGIVACIVMFSIAVMCVEVLGFALTLYGYEPINAAIAHAYKFTIKWMSGEYTYLIAAYFGLASLCLHQFALRESVPASRRKLT